MEGKAISDSIKLLPKIVGWLKKKITRVEYRDERQTVYEIKGRGKRRKTEGPFCTRCWEVDSILVSLHKTNSDSYKCPNCKTEVLKPTRIRQRRETSDREKIIVI